MLEWDPRKAISCYDELERLDREYDRIKKKFRTACDREDRFPYELSEELQALRRKMFELEKQEFDKLVARRRETARA